MLSECICVSVCLCVSGSVCCSPKPSTINPKLCVSASLTLSVALLSQLASDLFFWFCSLSACLFCLCPYICSIFVPIPLPSLPPPLFPLPLSFHLSVPFYRMCLFSLSSCMCVCLSPLSLPTATGSRETRTTGAAHALTIIKISQ
jgi:hypothetical protein